ncbi:MAG TPA: ABC transporter ATP-binding protein [Acidobacteriota bacterium]|nr:ABC transporter ATP-binding protein [Acidobacteriota bacterium]
MSKLLEVRGLHKSYDSGDEKLEILTDLSFSLEAGEMAGIMGVSGSGKSTLLHLIGGMDRPDSGSIRILDRELSSLTTLELSGFRNHTIGFVFQFHHLLPEFSALENVMMPLLLRGATAQESSEQAQALLQEVGLEKRSHHRPGELSGGEQQRVALARALVGKPRLLLADEPTGNVDPHTGEAIGALFRKVHEKHGLSSIIVTHNERLARLCTKAYRLENGKLNYELRITNYE